MVGMHWHGRNSGGKPPSVGSRVGLSLFFLFFFAIGSLFELLILHAFGQTLGQRFWQKAPCTIVASAVQERGQGSQPFAFVVSYRYEYQGRPCSGSAYQRDYSASSTYSEAQQLVQKYPEGRSTVCYVNPKNPSEVVLQRESLLLGLALPFPLIFVLIGAGGIYFTWRKRPPESEQPIASAALRRGKSGKGRYGLTALFALFALVGGGILYPLGIRPVARTVAARSWTPTPCRVLQAEVRSHSSDDGTTYSVYVLYQYELQGQTYKCDRYSFFGGSSSGYEGKARVVEEYKTAAHPLCYVNPADPFDAVLKRGFQAGLLVALIPLVFLLIGVGGLVGTLRPRRTTAPSNRAGFAQPAPTGRTLLAPKLSPKTKLAGMILVALFWNGIVSLFVWNAISSLVHGRPQWFMMLFLLPFVAVGLGLIGGVIYLFLALFNPRPTLELSSGTVPLGGAAELRWSFTGRPSRIDELTVTLRGVEEAKYRQGTNTCTDRNTFYEMELYRTSYAEEIAAGYVGFVLPPDTMHSFEAQNNKILWSLDLHGSIRNWPDVKETFPITVAPAGD